MREAAEKFWTFKMNVHILILGRRKDGNERDESFIFLNPKLRNEISRISGGFTTDHPGHGIFPAAEMLDFSASSFVFIFHRTQFVFSANRDPCVAK